MPGSARTWLRHRGSGCTCRSSRTAPRTPPRGSLLRNRWPARENRVKVIDSPAKARRRRWHSGWRGPWPCPRHAWSAARGGSARRRATVPVLIAPHADPLSERKGAVTVETHHVGERILLLLLRLLGTEPTPSIARASATLEPSWKTAMTATSSCSRRPGRPGVQRSCPRRGAGGLLDRVLVGHEELVHLGLRLLRRVPDLVATVLHEGVELLRSRVLDLVHGGHPLECRGRGGELVRAALGALEGCGSSSSSPMIRDMRDGSRGSGRRAAVSRRTSPRRRPGSSRRSRTTLALLHGRDRGVADDEGSLLLGVIARAPVLGGEDLLRAHSGGDVGNRARRRSVLLDHLRGRVDRGEGVLPSWAASPEPARARLETIVNRDFMGNYRGFDG